MQRVISSRRRIPSFSIEQLERRALLSAAVSGIVGPVHPTSTSGVIEDHEHELIEDLFPGIVNYRPNQTVLTRVGQYLTSPSPRPAQQVALSYLQSSTSTLRLDSNDVVNPIITSSYADQDTNTTYSYYAQNFNGIPVINATASVAVDRNGRVLTAASSFVDIPKNFQTPAVNVSAVQAMQSFAASVGIDLSRGISVTTSGDGFYFPVILNAPDLQSTPIDLKLVYVARNDGNLALAWHTDVDLPGGQNWFEIGVNASSGEIVFAADYVSHATYNVFPRPYVSPYDGPRQLITDIHDVTASPFGWHDTNGAAGAESTLTIGNNVDAYLDRDNNNTPDANGRPDGTAALNFNYPLDLTQAPTTTDNQRSAVTNLFYHNNMMHDITYGYGFTEVAGNFQTNNYGRGGVGNDAVNAEAQDGGGTNNANFATPVDGSKPRMQMYLWTNTTPNRDGDLDSQIIYHEYGHGVSNRLTGGPGNSSALSALQSGGMGEGWSDYFGVALTMKPTDTATTSRPMSPYALGQAANGVGIRAFPYNTNFAVNPMTANYVNNASGSVHYIGTVWMTALWEVTWELINAHGFEANVYGGWQPGRGGNVLATQLIIDGMKLQPALPRLSDARDAILQADLNRTGGQNQTRIWAAFARRGFGYSFNSGASASASTVVQAFDVPSPFPIVTSPATTTLGVGPSSAEFLFNENINPASFTVADDVVSFTNPSNQNIKNQITGHTWVTPNRLKINFATQSQTGIYKLKIGPNILAALDGDPMDQNLNGIPGEATDTFELSLNFNPYAGPDAFNYSAGPAKFDTVDLVPGGTGVTSILASVDDSSAAVSLGANTFNFYGTNVSTVYVSSNGLITTVSGSTSYTNGDLSSTPTQSTIAVLWDDWVTNVNTNDEVLWKLDDADNNGQVDRLIVEWNVYRYQQTTSIAVFQGILQLNTGATAGNITLNYLDLDTGNVASAYGASATNGIKDVGTQSTSGTSRRLLMSQDGSDSRWLGEGKAYRIGLDVVAPKINSSTFDFETGHRFRYTFSKNVQASLDPSDLVVTNPAGVPIPGVAVSNIAYNVGTNTATFTLNQILADGNYKVRLLGDGIRDASDNYLDGDGDLIPGGTNVMDFFVLAADANRDRAVNGLDFNILSANFGQSPRTFSQGDFNYDGVVNGLDFNILSSRFGQSLPPGAGGLQGRPGTPPAAPSLPPTGGGIAGGGDSRGGIMRWGAGGGSGSTGGSGSLIGTRVPTSPFGDEPIGLPTDGGGDAIL